MRVATDDILIIPFEQVGGLFQRSPGHAVLVQCGQRRLQVGAIIPWPDGKFLVDIQIFEEIRQIPYAVGKFSEVIESFESAVGAARVCLTSIRRAKE